MLKTPIGQHKKPIKLKNLRNSFTKWGGGQMIGLIERTPEWSCQVCGCIQPEAIDPFILPMSDREFLRICPHCEHVRIKYNIETFEILIEIRRKKDHMDIYTI